MERSSAQLLLGGEPIQSGISIRGNGPVLNEPVTIWFINAQEAFLLVHLNKVHYLWSKYPFKLSPPNENGAELFSMIEP